MSWRFSEQPLIPRSGAQARNAGFYTRGEYGTASLPKDTDGQPKPALQIFRNHGYNWIRLRVCVPPARLPQSVEYTAALAKAARKLGFKYLLDVHYSNE